MIFISYKAIYFHFWKLFIYLFNTFYCYSLRFQTGPIGNLYTDPDYRNRGFASEIVKSIFKQIGEHCGAVATVKRTNMVSRAIFEKIGCQVIDEIHWIATPCEWREEANMH